MNRGKKSIKWDRIRAELKQQFADMGITFCERCGKTYPLSFAHRLKRRYITDDGELRKVALLCIPCHEAIEFAGHDEMFQAITAIIENRREVFNFGA